MVDRSGRDRMRVLVLGADGLIGAAVCQALLAAGHMPVRGVHRQPSGADGAQRVQVDFVSDVHATDWVPRLQGIQAVVNAVGIFAEHGEHTFRRIHVDAPRALFAACHEAGIERVVQLSALGADEHARSRFHRSKRAGDTALLAWVRDGTVLQPSLVFGARGASSRMLLLLASLPLVALPDGGRQRIQPIHVDDLATLVVRLLEAVDPPARVAAVGPRALTLRRYLAILRGAIGGGRLRALAIPRRWLGALGRLGGRWLDPEALAMLERGNTADPAPVRRWLGHLPRPARSFLTRAEADDLRGWLAWRSHAALGRLAVALVWLVSGLVSLGLYPVADSLALLARAGLHGSLARFALYAGALLDVGLGLGTLLLRRRRGLYLAQIAVMLAYTAIISVRLPEFWLHPYGPLLKNLPMLVLTGALYAAEPRR